MKVWKAVLTVFFVIIIISMLLIYWFMGNGNEITLSSKPKSSNFSLGISDPAEMQFYKNMRYSDSRISYRVADLCNLQKKADAERAFEILSSATILNFYSVGSGEEILISCESKQRVKEDFFIAGEGGPVNITKAGELNVIFYGEVSLIRQSDCPNPNIALHEILHSLGFDHSSNSNNIMYNVSKCSQTLGDDIPALIDQIYSIPSHADLVFDEVSPVIHGKYLDVNMSIRNSGLRSSEDAVMNIYTGNSLLETIDVQPLEVGFGVKFTLKNVRVKKTDFDELKFVIVSGFNELDKTNNEIIFELKK